MPTNSNGGQPTPEPPIDLKALAMNAYRKGYSDPDRIIERLQAIITRNQRYVNRPYRKGRGYNEVVEEDCELMAYLIEIVETWKEEQP